MRPFVLTAALAIAGYGSDAPASPAQTVGPPTSASAVQFGAAALDVVVPAPPGTAKPVNALHSGLPVLIFVHGGAWTGGSRLTYTALSQTFANYGFIVFNVDYRLPPAVTVAGEITDVANAESWVLQNADKYGGDLSEVFVMGHSAGGHLVAMTMIDPQWLTTAGASRSKFRGWIDLSGSLNLATQRLTNPTVWPADAATTLNPLLRPVTGAPPLFTACASEDAGFACPDRDSIAALYKAAGMDVTTFLNPGHTHLSQVQVPAANNPADQMYLAIKSWMAAHY